MRAYRYLRVMEILLSHNSAYMALLQNAACSDARLPETRAKRVPRPDAQAVLAAKQLLPDVTELDVLVPSPSARCRGAEKCHVWSNPLPPGSVARLSEGVLASTPEFLFLQAAGRLPFVQLVQFGYELCALYTVRLPKAPYLELKKPLTTTSGITAYLEACDGAYGVRNARAAIPWVMDRSRSPRESKLAISLTLPRMKGGQAVRGLELNRVVPLTKREQRKAGKKHYEIDIYADGAKFGVEYYGRDFHEGLMRTVCDIRRESILKSKGITIHGITQSRAESVQELERVAEAILKAQGERWRKPTEQQERAMRRLMNELYPRNQKEERQLF